MKKQKYMLALLLSIVLAIGSVGIGVSVIDSAPSSHEEVSEPITVFKYYDVRESSSGTYEPEEDYPIEGWEFELWREEDDGDWELLDTNVTDEDGFLHFGEYPVDEHYRVREYLPEDWYNTGKAHYEGTELRGVDSNSVGLAEYDQDTEKYVDITFNHFEPAMVEFGNAEYGEITAYKHNELGEPIEGWEMTLMDDDENVLHTDYTNETGAVTFDELRSGTYIVEEEYREGWYTEGDSTQEVVLAGGAHEEVWFVNTEYGEITVNKMDQYEQPLEDWTFNLWEAEDGEPVGEPIDTVVTDENGTATFEEVEYGDYIVQEELKEGWYNLTELLQPVYVEPGAHEELWFMNTELGDITVYKYDEYENPLEGWTFNLWEAEDGEPVGEPIDTVVTDENGTATFEEVMYGDYIVQEELEDGWKNITELLQPVSLEPGAHEEVWFENTELGDILITKYLDNEPYEGMEFYLYEGDEIEDDEEPIMEGETGEDGTLMFEDLVSGNYTIQEMIPEDDEEYPWLPITDPVQTVTVEPGEVTGVDFYNEKAGRIEGMKFLDRDQTGEFNVGHDMPIEGWTIYLYEAYENGEGEIPMAGHHYDVTETDEHGEYSFVVPAGEYIVKEEMPEGWFATTDPEVQVSVESEQTVEVDFGNCQYKDLFGIKFYDYSMTGEFDEEHDEVIEGWEINLLTEENGEPGEIIETTETDHNGYYFFRGLEPGTYFVQEEDREGWNSTTPSIVEVEFEDCCSSKEMVNFGNYEFAEIEIYKFNDMNATGEFNPEEGDYLMEDLGVNFDVLGVTEDDVTVFDQTLNVEGSYSFYVDPAHYSIEEEVPEGWASTTGIFQEQTLDFGETWEAWFGNTEYGEIDVYKFYDYEMTGEYDEEYDWMLENWTFNLWEAEDGEPVEMIDTVVTDENGTATFDEVLAGDYIVEEELKDGWYNTTPLLQPVTVEAGEEYELWFGNVEGGMIEGYKFCDYEMAGEYYEDIETVEGWTIYLYQEGEQIDYTETDEDGYYMFEDLDPRVENYTVREEDREGWYSVSESMYTFEPTAGFEERFDFFNYQHHDITGIKFYDFTMSGEFEPKEGDIPLRGRQIKLYEGDEAQGEPIETTYTDEHGYYTFEYLEPGEYTVEQEKMCCDWEYTIPRIQTVEIRCDDVEVNFGEWKWSSIDVFVESSTEGVGVEIYEYEDGEQGELIDYGETGDHGWYISIDLEPGWYYVVLEDGQSELVQLRMGEQVEFEQPEDTLESFLEILVSKARHTRIR